MARRAGDSGGQKIADNDIPFDSGPLF